MTVSSPRVRAERCFALARSTQFDGERESAIKKGMAICERGGLSLDGFDIPGRARAAHSTADRFRMRASFDSGPISNISAEELREALLRFNAALRARDGGDQRWFDDWAEGR